MTINLTVLYDACVLYPNYLRDVLIQLATTNLFRAKWTEQIHNEWIRSILKNRPNTSAEKSQELKQKMNRAVPDCFDETGTLLFCLNALPASRQGMELVQGGGDFSTIA
jgi:hypothetical protein